MTLKGRAALAHDEGGHVLTAYLCSANVWTISVGLTAASGVVKPHRGMTITRDESERLFALALPKYERRVNAAMPDAKPHEFDGSTGFDYNTGAIARATWVNHWRARAIAAAESSFKQWNKAGGKVVRGLTLRRAREADMIFRGVYPAGVSVVERVERHDPDQRTPAMRRGDKGPGVRQLQEELAALGYDPGAIDGDFGDRTEAAVRAFQRAHPDLTTDGIAGPATLAQIQRGMDARKQATTTGAAGGGGAAAGAGGNEAAGPDVTGIPIEWLLTGVAGLTLIALAIIAWRYRDIISQRIAKARG